MLEEWKGCNETKNCAISLYYKQERLFEEMENFSKKSIEEEWSTNSTDTEWSINSKDE